MPTTLIENITRWYEGLRPSFQPTIAASVAIRLETFDPDTDPHETFIQWLTKSQNPFQHVGRTLAARALIDYCLVQYGDPVWWEQAQDATLDLLEREGVSAQQKAKINAEIPISMEQREDWISAGASWKAMRRSVLSDESIYQWEQETIERFGSEVEGQTGR